MEIAVNSFREKPSRFEIIKFEKSIYARFAENLFACSTSQTLTKQLFVMLLGRAEDFSVKTKDKILNLNSSFDTDASIDF